MSADFFTKLIAVQSLGPNVVHQKRDGGGAVVTYACPMCEDEHDDEDDADECCPREVPAEIIRCAVCRKRYYDEDDAAACHPGTSRGQPMQCMVCMATAESFEEAVDCCLPKHPTMTAWGRQRVAQSVADGTPWAEAVQANINH